MLWLVHIFKMYFYLQSEMMDNKYNAVTNVSDNSIFMKKYINILQEILYSKH